MAEDIEWMAGLVDVKEGVEVIYSARYKHLTLRMDSINISDRMHAELTCRIYRDGIYKKKPELIYQYREEKTQYPDRLNNWLDYLIPKRRNDLESIAKLLVKLSFLPSLFRPLS